MNCHSGSLRKFPVSGRSGQHTELAMTEDARPLQHTGEAVIQFQGASQVQRAGPARTGLGARAEEVCADVPALPDVLGNLLRRVLLYVIDFRAFAAMTMAQAYKAFLPETGELAVDSVARIALDSAHVGGHNFIVTMNPTDWLMML